MCSLERGSSDASDSCVTVTDWQTVHGAELCWVSPMSWVTASLVVSWRCQLLLYSMTVVNSRYSPRPVQSNWVLLLLQMLSPFTKYPATAQCNQVKKNSPIFRFRQWSVFTFLHHFLTGSGASYYQFKLCLWLSTNVCMLLVPYLDKFAHLPIVVFSRSKCPLIKIWTEPYDAFDLSINVHIS